MTQYRYRAVRPNGTTVSGLLRAVDQADAVAGVRRLGAAPQEIVAQFERTSRPGRIGAKARAEIAVVIGELAVLLNAGLPLDRAFALSIDNLESGAISVALSGTLRVVREGASLSAAMARRPDIFTPTAIAMTEAGEVHGRLSRDLARLSAMMQQEAELRQIVTTSMIYPLALLIVAVGVVGMMLLFVVPQFEVLFASAPATLPTASRMVMAASRGLRSNWHWLLFMLIAIGVGTRQILTSAAVRPSVDRITLGVPQLGSLVRKIETARFVRTLAILIEGEVPLPRALALARRTIGNRVIGEAIGKVAAGVKEGSGLTVPLAATGVLPRIAIGFFRTGEESSQLALMLARLADVLDRDVRVGLQRVIGIATPAITVILGMTVAAIIASIMSAILGFNDLVVAS